MKVEIENALMSYTIEENEFTTCVHIKSDGLSSFLPSLCEVYTDTLDLTTGDVVKTHQELAVQFIQACEKRLKIFNILYRNETSIAGYYGDEVEVITDQNWLKITDEILENL